jgi:hypothetical protein
VYVYKNEVVFMVWFHVANMDNINGTDSEPNKLK